MIHKIRTHIKQNPLKYKIAYIITMAAAGLTISARLMGEGIRLIEESGVPEETIKAIFGVVFSVIGLYLFLYFMVNPMTKLFRVFNKENPGR